ncbi:hypothetical protein VTJ04DRAFT_7931 [Mycothermus thermophilus]|uniref:uncharacterized protein n=1 Tax=Humicola insolens TaxID=85995 RepID=UPI0037434D8C
MDTCSKEQTTDCGANATDLLSSSLASIERIPNQPVPGNPIVHPSMCHDHQQCLLTRIELALSSSPLFISHSAHKTIS